MDTCLVRERDGVGGPGLVWLGLVSKECKPLCQRSTKVSSRNSMQSGLYLEVKINNPSSSIASRKVVERTQYRPSFSGCNLFLWIMHDQEAEIRTVDNGGNSFLDAVSKDICTTMMNPIRSKRTRALHSYTSKLKVYDFLSKALAPSCHLRNLFEILKSKCRMNSERE